MDVLAAHRLAAVATRAVATRAVATRLQPKKVQNLMASDFSTFNTALVWVYNSLLFCIPLFVILGIAQLVTAIALWRSDKRVKRLKRAGALLIAAALMPLVLMGFWRGIMRPSMGAELTAQHQRAMDARHSESSILRTGDEAPQIDELLVSAGVSLVDKKILVVNFFATWCGPCLTELPHFQKLADKYVDKRDIAFVVIGREETQATLDAFVADNYRIPFIADPERKLYAEFAKELIPRTYLIDRDRKIRFEIIGFDEKKLGELDRKISELARE